MKLERLAARDAIAQQRIAAAALAISNQQGLDPALAAAVATATHRDPRIRALRHNEAIAAFLEALSDSQSSSPASAAPDALFERLTAIQGIGDAKARQIMAALEGE